MHRRATRNAKLCGPQAPRHQHTRLLPSEMNGKKQTPRLKMERSTVTKTSTVEKSHTPAIVSNRRIHMQRCVLVYTLCTGSMHAQRACVNVHVHKNVPSHAASTHARACKKQTSVGRNTWQDNGNHDAVVGSRHFSIRCCCAGSAPPLPNWD